MKALPNYRFAVENNLPMWKKMLFALVGARLDRLAARDKKNITFYLCKPMEDSYKRLLALLKMTILNLQLILLTNLMILIRRYNKFLLVTHKAKLL